MGTYHEAFWESDRWGGSRDQRASGAYRYYVPDKLNDLHIKLDADVVGDLDRASAAIESLNHDLKHLHGTDGIARLLLRAEAVSSSYIEGLTIGTRRLLKSELNADGTLWGRDETAAVVLGNVRAMQEAIAASVTASEVTVATIRQIHRALCDSTPLHEHGGKLRSVQNWVGGSAYNPLRADYVPPAPEYVEELLEDVADFCNRRDVPPILKAALVHAQFESIHPFVDGNGRTGRALIHTVLKRGIKGSGFVPPISLIMATHSKSYITVLNGFRFDSSIPKARDCAINEWVSFFAGCVSCACEEARAFERDSDRLIAGWSEKLGRVRGNSAIELLLDEVIGMPLFTVKTAARAIGRSIPATTNAIERLLEIGAVRQISAKERNRVFEVPDVIEQFNIFERRLASPIGDTSIEPPVRNVPAALHRSD